MTWIRGAMLLMLSMVLAGIANTQTIDTESSTEHGTTLLLDCRAITDVDSRPIRNDEAISAAFCLGIVHGTMVTATDYGKLACLPAAVHREQVARIVVKYLNSHPEKLHKDAHILVIEALREAFPCSK